jgi:tocopherol O-methyltransferase
MLSCATVEREVIRGHYDLTTPFYRLFWGPHIHHGLWEANESPREAQLQLTERLATMARVESGHQLVDIGCGMGASSIHLAKSRNCSCLGVTISPLQRNWAAMAARWHRVAGRVQFRCADAEQVELHKVTFDVVWSVECTEHLFDKPRFFKRAAAWLKPGGTMAICAWLAGDTSDSVRAGQAHDVCEGFLCPSLGTREDYSHWLTQAGLQIEQCLDWTSQVGRTWEICRERVRRCGIRRIAPVFGRNSVLFLDRFDSILEAYKSGAMAYGCFIAHKPNA